MAELTSIMELQQQLDLRKDEATQLLQELQEIRGRLYAAEQSNDALHRELQEVNTKLGDAVSTNQQLSSEHHQLREKLTQAESRLNVLLGVSEQPQNPQQKAVVAASLNGKPLREFVLEVLQNSNEPLTTTEISELVLEAGYKTTGDKKNLPTMVLQCLTRGKEFKKVSRGQVKPYRFALVEEDD